MSFKRRTQLLLSGLLLLSAGFPCQGQSTDPPASPPEAFPAPSPEAGQRHGGRRGPMEGHATIGQITAIHGHSFSIKGPDGTKVTVKLTDKTEFRKDRQPAKQADFKVGDFVMVRGEQDANHSITAVSLGGRSAGGGPGGGFFFGEMGKDFLAGEVKSLDPPKVTLQRTDNAAQTVELNEETSLRKGRESITMADIQPGDHLVMHGTLQNGVFVPKTVMLVSPEQWERMPQFARGGATTNGKTEVPPGTGKPPQP